VKDTDRKPFTIAGGETEEISCYGDKLVVESATFPFELRIASGNANLVKPGVKLNLDGELFTKIRIRNATSSRLDGALWVGTGLVDFLFPFTPPTGLRPTTGSFASGGVGGAVTFPGIATNNATYSTYGIAQGNRRKQFVISNKVSGTGSDIFITTSDGTVFGVVSGNSDYTLETDATFKIYGGNGNAYYVAELFYL